MNIGLILGNQKHWIAIYEWILINQNYEKYSFDSSQRRFKRYKKRKNIRLFNNKPLIYWTIKNCFRKHYIDRVVVSTDDDEIADISCSFCAEVPHVILPLSKQMIQLE